MFLTSFLLFLFLNKTNCFNIDTNFPIIYKDPQSENSSYFGYSVILYPGNKINAPWLLVGAPRSNNPFKNYKNPGVCFKCGIGERCNVLNFTEYFQNYEEIFDGAWIGGSMDISYKFGRVAVCAPRWIKVKKRQKVIDDYLMEGACFWFHINDNTTQKLVPLINPAQAIYSVAGGAVYNYAQGQAGISAHMPVKENSLILGAPGVFNWDGTVISYRDSDEPSPVASRLQNPTKRYADIDEFSQPNIASARLTSQTVAYDLFGYSTTSGYFHSKSQLLYATAAPRSEYKGQVLIYQFSKYTDTPLIVKEVKYGNQFGEYFGGSLAAGDINNDGLDDLIVGAPFHTTEKYNEGKVYIFLGNKKGPLQPLKRESLVGKSTNAQFGSTVQFLGDVDHDGFGDIAVAAPYEEDSGVVYLYRGATDGLKTIPCQRIVGKEIYQGIKGFGVSISRPADIDSNNYPDFAIGAHLSGHVVVLRSRPVVTVFQSLRSFLQQLDFNEKRFQIRACFWYRLDELDYHDITISRYLLVDQQLGRAHLDKSDYSKIINFGQNRQICENFTILLQNSFTNHYKPITITLKHKFQSKTEEKKAILSGSNSMYDDLFCLRCPVYNKNDSISSSTLEIPFALGCGSDNICKASLEFIPKITDIREDGIFILGSKNYITLETIIQNLGERAYLTQLEVQVPEIVTFRSTPSACAEQNSSVVCSVDNPLEGNSQKKITLELDMTNVNSGKSDEALIFTIRVITSSENDKENTKKIIVKLGREADVTITGKSEEQSYSYINITQGRPNFTQIYQVEKFGSSPLNEISIEINIPHIYYHDGTNTNFISLYQPVGSLAGQKLSCTSNFTYIIENKSDFDIFGETSLSKVRSRRSLDQIEVFNKTNKVRERNTDSTFEALQNRTYYVNCSVPGVVCSKVICSAGPIDSYQTARIKLKMLFDINSIKDFLGKKDVILFATQGRVLVTNPVNFVQNGDKTDSVEVVSLFIGETKEKVELWIIIISVIAGLLLLLLVILGLIKAGFFKRKAKEELEQLKKEMEFDQNGSPTLMDEMEIDEN